MLANPDLHSINTISIAFILWSKNVTKCLEIDRVQHACNKTRMRTHTHTQHTQTHAYTSMPLYTCFCSNLKTYMYGVPACTVYHKHPTLVSNSMLAQLGSTCMVYVFCSPAEEHTTLEQDKPVEGYSWPV